MRAHLRHQAIRQHHHAGCGLSTRPDPGHAGGAQGGHPQHHQGGLQEELAGLRGGADAGQPSGAVLGQRAGPVAGPDGSRENRVSQHAVAGFAPGPAQ